ncbi:MAG: cysteine desulfurase family protein [Patescibacteria group bacterium]|nr:cysteine desulfurase family protein [Patescibacteria group bacterium]
MKKIYLDYAATTPVDKKVLVEMMPYFAKKFGNPSSVHQFGQEALEGVDNARLKVADFLHCLVNEVIFTSGATESNNLAIKGVIKATQIENPHIITSAIEHHCVLNACQTVQKDKIAEVSFVKVNKDGIINVGDIKNVIKDNTILVSIMYANNEVGTIQPIAEIGKMLKEINIDREKNNLSRIYFHTDAVQAVNYLDCDVNKLGVDFLSLSGHKIYGPKGIGVLYIRQESKIKSIQQGGEQEYNLRAGTHNVPCIVGIGKAISLVIENRKKMADIKKLRDYMIDKVLKNISGSQLNGSKELRLPHNINISFKGIEGESLLMMFDQEGIAVSTGSACSSASLAPSHVLSAMGIPPEIAHASIRFTLGKETTKENIDYTLKVLIEKIKRLRKISGM